MPIAVGLLLLIHFSLSLTFRILGWLGMNVLTTQFAVNQKIINIKTHVY